MCIRDSIEAYLKQTKFESVMSSLREYLFVAQYEKGEFIATPFQKEPLFQIIIQGTVNIYLIRDDGTVYSLANGRKNDLLGAMAISAHPSDNVYAETRQDETGLIETAGASQMMLPPLFIVTLV